MTSNCPPRRPARRHGPGGRERHAHASAHRSHAQAADRGRRQAAARQCARPPGREPASRPPSSTSIISPTRSSAIVAGRRAPRIVISDERASLLDTGGGVVKALPSLGAAPFYHLNSDTIWIDGVKSNLVRLAEGFDPAKMDALLLLAATSSSVGYAGRGDFAMAPDGRLRRRTEREVAPFVYAGVAILSPALFDGAPGRAVLAQPPVRSRHRGRPVLRPAARRRVDARGNARRDRRCGSRDPRQCGVMGRVAFAAPANPELHCAVERTPSTKV